MRRLLVLVTCVLTVSANASIIPTLVSTPSDLLSGLFNYQASVSGDERLDPAATNGKTCFNVLCTPPGTFFTVYDINNFVGASASAAGWAVSMQLIGLTPSSISTSDNASLPNVTFTYTGPVVIGPVTITGFQIVSNDTLTAPGTFTSQSTNNTPDPLNGQADQVIGPVSVPAGVVPEPAYTALIFAGLMGLAFARRRFKR